MTTPPFAAFLAIATGIAVVAAAAAGFTPWAALAALPSSLAAPRLLLFWCVVAGAVPALLLFLRHRQAGFVVIAQTHAERWLPGFVLLTVVISISAQTYPANAIKAGLFDLLLPTMALLLVWRRYRVANTVSMLLPALLLFLAILLCSSLLSGDIVRGCLLLWRLTAYAIWFAVVATVFPTPSAAQPFWRLLSILAVLVSIYGLFQAADLDPAQWGKGFSLPDLQVTARAMATFGNPNFFGAFLVVTIPLLFRELHIATNRNQRLLICLFLVFPLLALLFSYNRAGYLGLLAAAITYCTAAGISWRRQFVAGLIILLVVLTVFPGSFRQRILFWQHGLSGDDTVRLAIWSAAAQLAVARPLLGSGPGTFNQAVAPFLPNEFHHIYLSPQYIIEHAHSELLELLAETGTIGTIAALLLLVGMTRLLWNNRRISGYYGVTALASLSAALVHALFETKLRYASTAVPLLFIVASALSIGSFPTSTIRRCRLWTGIATVLSTLLVLQAWAALQANIELKSELDCLFAAQRPENAGALREAEQALERSLALDPKQLFARYKRFHYRVTLQNQPYAPDGWHPDAAFVNFQDAALLYARSCLLQGKPALGIPLADHYCALYPLDIRGPFLRAELFAHAGMPLAALEILARIPQTLRDREEYYSAQARLLLATAERYPEIASDCRRAALSAYQFGAAKFPAATSLRTALLATALEKNDLDDAFANFRILAQATNAAPAPTVKQLLETLINRLLAVPTAARQYLLPCGDLLATMRQPQQALIVYRAASRVGVPDNRVIGRVARLALRERLPDELDQLAGSLRSAPETRIAGTYLAARAQEMRGNSTAAIELGRAILAEAPMHLGAIALLQRLGLSRDANLAQARAQLGAAFANISDSDPRWSVATSPITGGTLPETLTVTSWITPHLPDAYDGEWLASTDGDTQLFTSANKLPSAPIGHTHRLSFSFRRLAETQGHMPRTLKVYCVWHSPEVFPTAAPVVYPVGTLTLPLATISPPVTTDIRTRAPQPSSAMRTPRGKLLAQLDRLAAQNDPSIPIAVWFPGAQAGLYGDYWRRWEKTPLAMRAEFRNEVARQLLRQKRYRETKEWLTSFPSGLRANRFLLANALAGCGDTDAAEALFTQTDTAAWDAPAFWEWGQWLKATGRTAATCITFLRRAGAEGWATLLNGEMFGPHDPEERVSYVAHEFPGGLFLLDSISGLCVRSLTPYTYEFPLYLVSEQPASGFSLTCLAKEPEQTFRVSFQPLQPGTLVGLSIRHREPLHFAYGRRDYFPQLYWHCRDGSYACGTPAELITGSPTFITIRLLPWLPPPLPKRH